jgi:Gpi18-like mannosyltransferase
MIQFFGLILRPPFPLLTILFLALFIRLLLSTLPAYPTDINTFHAWAQTLAEHGLARFYETAGFADYTPGYLYVLWLLGKIDQLLNLETPAMHILLKLPAIVADIGIGWLLFRFALFLTSHRTALVAASFYLFNPAVIFLSAVWGQVEAVAALPLVAAAGHLVARRYSLSFPFLALACLIKPLIAVVSPLFLLLAARDWFSPPNRGKIIQGLIVTVALVIFLSLPFRLSPWELVNKVQEAAAVYPFSSVMAWNLWHLVQGSWRSDTQAILLGLTPKITGLILSLGGIMVILWALGRQINPQKAVLAAALLLMTVFLLATRMHERYVFATLPLLALPAALDLKVRWPFFLFSTVFFLNLLWAYRVPFEPLPIWLEKTLFAREITLLGAALFIVIFGVLFCRLVDGRKEPISLHVQKE